MTPRILVGQSLRLYALFLGAQCLGVFALWLLFDPPGPVMQTATDAQYAKFGTWMVLASLLFWKAGRVADRVTPARRSSLAFPGAGLALASLSVVGVGMGVRALGLLITDRVSIAGLDPGAEALVKAADSTIRNLILLGVGCVLVAGPRLAAYLRGSPRMESAPFSPPPFAAASLKLLAILMIAMALRGLETWPVLLEHVAEMSRLISPNNRFLEPGDVEQFELLMSLERSLVRVHLFPVVFMLAFGVGLLTRWGSIGTGNRPVPGTAAPMAELTHGALRAFALGGIAALSVVNACQRAAWYGTRGTPWYDAGVVLLSLALAAALFLMVSRDRMRTDKDTKVDAYWIQAPLGSAGLLRAACAGAALWLGLYAVTCAGRWWLDEAPPFDGTSMAEFGIGHWGRVGHVLLLVVLALVLTWIARRGSSVRHPGCVLGREIAAYAIVLQMVPDLAAYLCREVLLSERSASLGAVRRTALQLKRLPLILLAVATVLVVLWWVRRRRRRDPPEEASSHVRADVFS